MKKLLLALLLLPQIALSQLHDNAWLFGYQIQVKDSFDLFGVSMLTFPEGGLKIEQNYELDLNFSETNTSFSDSLGDVLSYTNGVHIGNSAWEIMEGGEHLTDAPEIAGELHTQWVLILPWPGQAPKQLYFYEREHHTSELSVHATHLYSATIDMTYNAGLGQVTERDVLLIVDTLAVGKLSAARHANGRDWWVLVNEKNSNRFYRILVDTGGVHLLGSQTVGIIVMDGVGQSLFSPNGEHYVVFAADSPAQGSHIDLYNFDRCEGLLSNHRTYKFLPGKLGGGGISPDSRYLYVNYRTQAFQYDLEAPDVWASQVQVAEYDGFLDPFHTTFYNMQLAPDGKIYSSSTNGVKSLHVIHRPDEPGLACLYQQHGIALPTYNSFSMPSFPNYRLGPLDGSPCDTLGLDNLPISWWRSEQDTLDPLLVSFHDLSYYEPAEWYWDFGDPASGVWNTSTDRHPEHPFSGPGAYEVCLRVVNANGEHTLCRTLQLGSTLAEDPEVQERVLVAPNPFGDWFSVSLSAVVRSPVVILYDQLGRVVLREPLLFGVTEIGTGHLSPGIYFYRVEASGERVKSGKLIRIRG